MLAIDTKLNITLACEGKNNFIIGIKWINYIALINVHIISIDPPATIEKTVDVVKAIAIDDDAAYPIAVTPGGIYSYEGNLSLNGPLLIVSEPPTSLVNLLESILIITSS